MPDGIIAAIEPGETSARVAAARYREGSVRLLAVGEAPGEGIQRGRVADAGAVARAVRAALRIVERQLGYPLYSAVLCVPGAIIHAQQSQAAGRPSGPRRSVSERDAARILARAQPRFPDGRERALHVLPMRYTVDGVVYEDPPVRVRGRELTVSTCALVTETAIPQDLTAAVEAAGIRVTDLVAAPLAASLAALSEAEQRLGVLLVEIGARSTTLALLQRGCFLYAASIPVGGYHFTNDLAAGLSIPFETAERLKLEHGALYLEEDVTGLSVPGERGTPVTVQRQEMVSLLRDRAQEILALAASRIQSAGWEHLPTGGIVLTGASARLSGMERLARDLLRVPARIGRPRGLEASPAPFQDPAWVTPAGALLWKGLCLSGERSLLAAPSTLEATPLAQRLTTWAGRIFETPAPQATPERQRTESSLAAVGAVGGATARDG